MLIADKTRELNHNRGKKAPAVRRLWGPLGVSGQVGGRSDARRVL